MHFMWFGVLHHVIVLAVVAFFVLFAASKADGFVKILGNVLGYLFLILAVLSIVCAAIAPNFAGHPFGMTFMERMHHGMMGPGSDQPPGPPPAPAPAPGK